MLFDIGLILIGVVWFFVVWSLNFFEVFSASGTPYLKYMETCLSILFWILKIRLRSSWFRNRKPHVPNLLWVMWTSRAVFACGRGVSSYYWLVRPWTWSYFLPYWYWRSIWRLLKWCDWRLLIYNIDANSISIPSSQFTGTLQTRSSTEIYNTFIICKRRL